MKPRILTLLTLTLLASLLIGAGAILVLSQKPVGANVKWDPKTFTWNDGSPPDPWEATVWLKGGHKAQKEINHTTIRLHDSGETYEPIYALIRNSTHGPKLIVPFSGNDVKAALDAKLPYHMGIVIPGRYRISLRISGYLKAEYGGLYFEGYGVIVVTVTGSGGP